MESPGGNSCSSRQSTSPNEYPRRQAWSFGRFFGRTNAYGSQGSFYRNHAGDFLSQISVPPLNVTTAAFTPALSTLNVVRWDYIDLYHSVVNHVKKFYNLDICTHSQKDLRNIVRRASEGCYAPVDSLTKAINNSHTREAALIMIIAWSMLSRCLLINRGRGITPGNTLLPPEVVACFQSFELDQLEKEDVIHGTTTKWALLSSWKQTVAYLMHSKYVTNGSWPIDSRAASVERALLDLEPLLKTYTHPQLTSRQSELREIFQKAARFSFVLLSEPSLWYFDWEENVSIEWSSSEVPAREARLEHIDEQRKNMTSGAKTVSFEAYSFIIWPSLLRILDTTGRRIPDDGRILAEGRYLSWPPM